MPEITCQRCGESREYSPSHAKVRRYCSIECGNRARSERAQSKDGVAPRQLRARACITCGGERDATYAYTTNQGKRSVRTSPRCRACGNAQRRALHGRDREQSRKSSKAWKDANRKEIADYARRRQAIPEVRAMKACHQRLRKARLRAGQPNTPEIRAIYDLAMKEENLIRDCPVFDLPELGHKLHVDHIKPLARGGQHAIENLQILAGGLNLRKWAHA